MTLEHVETERRHVRVGVVGQRQQRRHRPLGQPVRVVCPQEPRRPLAHGAALTLRQQLKKRIGRGCPGGSETRRRRQVGERLVLGELPTLRGPHQRGRTEEQRVDQAPVVEQVDVAVHVGVGVALEVLKRRDSVLLHVRLAELAEVAPGTPPQVAPRRQAEKDETLLQALANIIVDRLVLFPILFRGPGHRFVGRDDDLLRLAGVNHELAGVVVGVGRKAFAFPFARPRFGLIARGEAVPFVPVTRLAGAADGAVQRHQEQAHQFVVAGLLGTLEQSFDQSLVPVGVERLGKVVDQQFSGGGPWVGQPACGKVAEPFGVVNAAQLGHERRVAAPVQLFRQSKGTKCHDPPPDGSGL